MPTVSVVLTSYNHQKFIGEAIESVLKQTYKDFELIIVDDDSTDNSWELINSYMDDRIIKIKNKKNMRAEGFYNAIKIAKGKYIAIHHSDDIWMPGKLEKQVTFLDENPNYVAVFTKVDVIDEKGQPFLEKNHFYYNVFEQPNRNRFEWLNYFFYYGNALCHPSILIKKECYYECELFDFGYGQIPDFLK
jgi:glycosyltransferase involved in cell wall biosynthesis